MSLEPPKGYSIASGPCTAGLLHTIHVLIELSCSVSLFSLACSCLSPIKKQWQYRIHCKCRYWCKLSSLSAEGGPSPCMPVLIATFRSLLNEAEPDLEAHLHSVGFSPTHCAIKWIVSGFVNVLEVEEVRSELRSGVRFLACGYVEDFIDCFLHSSCFLFRV